MRDHTQQSGRGLCTGLYTGRPPSGNSCVRRFLQEIQHLKYDSNFGKLDYNLRKPDWKSGKLDKLVACKATKLSSLTYRNLSRSYKG